MAKFITTKEKFEQNLNVTNAPKVLIMQESPRQIIVMVALHLFDKPCTATSHYE